ncbi:MAG: Gfo/Idh/MocA family oxidoreductase, partial [bacterium]
AEVRPKLRAQLAAKYGVTKTYASHLELAADKTIDAVGVSASFVAQSTVACDCLRAGKAVFMEKPMAVSVAQAEKMLAAERAGKGRLMVAYMKRYDAGNEIVKATVDGFRKSGELGPVTFMRNHGFCGAQWNAGSSNPFLNSDEPYPPDVDAASHYPAWLPADRRNAYVGYLQQYTHNVNLLRWLTDAGDVAVKFVDLDATDGISGIAVLDVGGVRTTIESGSMSHWGWDEHTQVYFRDGWVRTEAPPLLLKNVPASVEVYRAGKTQSMAALRPGESGDRWSWSYQREAAHFIECVRTGTPFRSSGADTLHDVRTFEMIYKAFLKIA